MKPWLTNAWTSGTGTPPVESDSAATAFDPSTSAVAHHQWRRRIDQPPSLCRGVPPDSKPDPSTVTHKSFLRQHNSPALSLSASSGGGSRLVSSSGGEGG